jgi:hypothetical protein
MVYNNDNEEEQKAIIQGRGYWYGLLVGRKTIIFYVSCSLCVAERTIKIERHPFYKQKEHET